MKLELILTLLASATALAAAARSTWSPCGLSMLSSITPFGEKSRGHRYGVTAAWFVVGATLGGASLGAIAGVAAVASVKLGVNHHPAPVALVLGGVALIGAAVDARVFGDVLPVVRRQVNDRWLSRYRGWVYGVGFGWQIGVGFTTYVMTSSLVVFLAFAAAAGKPVEATCVATGFGAARGLAVLLTSNASDARGLRALHVQLDRASEPVRWTAIAVQVISALILGGFVSPVWAGGCAALVGAAIWVQAKPSSTSVPSK